MWYEPRGGAIFVAMLSSAKQVKAQLDVTRAHMQLVIAEASAAVDARFDKNLAEAKERAAQVRKLAEFADKLTAITVSQKKGPEIVLIYRGLEVVSVVRNAFQFVFETFRQEHGALLEASIVDSIDRFWTWLDTQMALVRPVWREFVLDYERGLRESVDDNKALAGEWSSTAGDGLDDHG